MALLTCRQSGTNNQDTHSMKATVHRCIWSRTGHVRALHPPVVAAQPVHTKYKPTPTCAYPSKHPALRLVHQPGAPKGLHLALGSVGGYNQANKHKVAILHADTLQPLQILPEPTAQVKYCALCRFVCQLWACACASVHASLCYQLPVLPCVLRTCLLVAHVRCMYALHLHIIHDRCMRQHAMHRPACQRHYPAARHSCAIY